MIIQGSNVPITIMLDTDDSTVIDMSVSLEIPGYEIKHWDMEDLQVSENGTEYKAPITQQESMNWEAGFCTILVKWTDSTGTTQFALVKDRIVKWNDKTVLGVEAT